MYQFFNNCKTISGHKVLSRITYELTGNGVSRPMLISDEINDRLGYVKKIKKAFNDGVIVIERLYCRVNAAAETAQINKLVGEYRARGCDSIIAVGNANVTETAKCMKALIAAGADKLESLDALSAKESVPYLVVVPTIIGSGSETTNYACAVSEQGTRYDVKGKTSWADLVVLDDVMTDNVPPALIAEYMSYAASRALLGYMSIESNPASRAAARASIACGAESYKKLIKKSNLKKERLLLMTAMVLSDIVYEGVKYKPIHQLSLAVGGIYNISYMNAFTSLFSAYLKLADIDEQRAREICVLLEGRDVTAADGWKKALLLSLRNIKYNLYETTGYKYHLKEYGVAADDIPKIVDIAMQLTEKSDVVYKDKYDDLTRLITVALEG